MEEWAEEVTYQLLGETRSGWYHHQLPLDLVWDKIGLEVLEAAVKVPGNKSVWVAAGVWQLWQVYQPKYLTTTRLGDRVSVVASAAKMWKRRKTWELEGLAEVQALPLAA